MVRLSAQGLDACLVWLDGQHKARKLSPLSWSQCLAHLGRAAAPSHPQAALSLFKQVMKLPAAPVSALLFAGLLQDKLGLRAEALVAVRGVVKSTEASHTEVLQAANLLVRLGEQALALAAASRAFDGMGRPLEHAANLLYIAQATAHWPLVDALTTQLRAAYVAGKAAAVNESPRTHLLWCDDEPTNLAVLLQWSKKNVQTPVLAAPVAVSPQGRRLRVGYLSSDFREHPTARLILGVLRQHDRQQVELFMYCSGWDDGSALRREVVAQFEQVHPVAALGDEAAAQLMRSHQIDVLVELNGPTRANRMGILSHRPAPVQIGYLGWPGSVGGRVVDYVVGDACTVPEGAEKRYPEAVIRLHPTYQANDHAAQRLLARPSRAAVGLPEHPAVVVLGVFNAINKVHQAVWDAWMQILLGAPQAMLWILDPGPVAREHVLKAAQQAGVDRLRVVLAPKLGQEQHLARLQCCDLMLDPWPYGGHTSTADALFAGVPVLALEGRNFAARVSAGLLRAAGFDSLVAGSPPAYVQRALQLLGEPGALARLQAQVKAQAPRSAVFDAAGRARQLEQAYRVAVQRVADGLPVVHMRVQPPAPQATSPALPTRPAVVPGPVDWSAYRVAVVTPYFRIEPEKLLRCCASVAAQTLRCDHILVADGEPQALPEGFELFHMSLPGNVGNGGAMPRGFGAQYAFAQGYDAVAFLDADNWYEPHHIEQAVQAMEREAVQVVYARRRLVFPDGEVLAGEDPEDASGRHVDTNCYVISRRAAFLASHWAMYPKEFGSGEDRYIKWIIDAKKLKTHRLPHASVWYETNWSNHYRMAGKAPVAPLRLPKRNVRLNWDAQLVAQRTGLRLQVSKAADPAAVPAVPVTDGAQERAT
jgi:predicted O-linked N-acetylglucosamine transferase (SPINDLY family)